MDHAMTASDLCPIFRRPHSATRRLHGYRGPEQAGHGVRGGAVRRGEGEGQVPFITKIFEFLKYFLPKIICSLGSGKSCLCNRFVAPLADDYSVDHISVLSQVKIFPDVLKIFHIPAVTLDIRILIFELMRPPALVPSRSQTQDNEGCWVKLKNVPN